MNNDPKPTNWFNRYRTDQGVAVSLLSDARKKGNGPPYNEVIAKNGRIAYLYKPEDVVSWLDNNKITFEVIEPPLKPQRYKDDHSPRFNYWRQEYRRMKIEYEEKLKILTHRITELKKKLGQVTPGKCEFGLESLGSILGLARPIESHVGVYFLIKNNEIIYIGQTTNLHARIATHRSNKNFDYFSFLPVEKDMLDITERAYITKFNPKLNSQHYAFDLSDYGKIVGEE